MSHPTEAPIVSLTIFQMVFVVVIEKARFRGYAARGKPEQLDQQIERRRT
jgi:hypothetical protein